MKALPPENAYSEQRLAERCARAEAEIERLRADLSEFRQGGPYRNAIIEECARVADDLGRIMGLGGKAGAREIADAIRALKDKT